MSQFLFRAVYVTLMSSMSYRISTSHFFLHGRTRSQSLLVHSVPSCPLLFAKSMFCIENAKLPFLMIWELYVYHYMNCGWINVGLHFFLYESCMSIIIWISAESTLGYTVSYCMGADLNSRRKSHAMMQVRLSTTTLLASTHGSHTHMQQRACT